MGYVYNDEDNAPMNDDPFNPHNPTVYGSIAEMKAVERGYVPFEEPPKGCWNCLNYDPGREACTIRWNNLDEDYYNPDIDDREPSDLCDCWDLDKGADYEDFFEGGNENG